MLYIGNHTSSSRGYLAMGKQMLANGGNTFAFFTRNPRGGKAKDIDPQDVQAFVESQADSQLVKGFQYFKVCDDYQLEYILVAHGDDEDTYMVGKLAAFQVEAY